MTAPLPPLPDIEQAIYERCRRFVDLDVQEAMGVIMRDFAKLAVREALECAAKKFDQYPGVYTNAGSVLRDMIEEYK